MFDQINPTLPTYQQVYEKTAKLSSKFRAVGFRNCVLRGVAVARFYPSPENRPVEDIYLWVKGRRKDIRLWLQEQSDLMKDCGLHVVYRPNTLPNPFFDLRLQKWYAKQIQSQVINDGKLGFAIPTVPFLAIQSLVDSYNRLRGRSISMLDIWDYYYILLALKPNDRLAVIGLIKRLGLKRMAEAMMWVLKEKCGLQDNCFLCQPNEKRGLRLLEKLS